MTGDVVDALMVDVRLWKEELVRSEGIGADAAPSVYAFDGDGGLLGFAVLAVGVESREDQFRRVAGVCELMRVGWGAVGLAVVLEGFLCLEDRGGDARPLGERFASGDALVVETVSVVFRDVLGGSRICSFPYRLTVPRQVVWLEELARDVSEPVAGGYPWLLERVFEVCVPWRVEAVPFEVGFLGASVEMVGLGFAVVSPWLEDGWGEGVL